MWRGGSSCFSSLLGILKESFACKQCNCFHGDPSCFWLPQDIPSYSWEEDAAQSLASPVWEKQRMEAQTQARTGQSHGSGAHRVTLVPRFCSVDRHKQPPRPHVSAGRPECQYGVIFIYRYTQNSRLNTTGSKNTRIQKHFRHMRTHSSVLSSRTASMSGRGKISRNTTATESMRAYSLNYLSSSLKSVLCSHILMLAPFPADKQLSFPHPTAPHPQLVLPVPKVCAHFLLVPHSLYPSGFFLPPSHTLDFSTIFST